MLFSLGVTPVNILGRVVRNSRREGCEVSERMMRTIQSEGKETCPEGVAFQVESKGNRNLSHPRISWPQILNEILG